MFFFLNQLGDIQTPIAARFRAFSSSRAVVNNRR